MSENKQVQALRHKIIEYGTLRGAMSINRGSELFRENLDAAEKLFREIEADLAVLSTSAGERLVDKNVQANIDLLHNRSVVGMKKYGVATSDARLSAVQWMDHAIDELLDGANYLQACKRQMLSIRSIIADDSTAMTFQSMGAYRSHLLKEFDIRATNSMQSTNKGIK